MKSERRRRTIGKAFVFVILCATLAVVTVSFGCACADALEFDGAVVQLTGAQSGDVLWNKSNFGAFCYNLSDGACVGTETLTIADGTLEGPDSDQTIDENSLTYTTQPISREYELYRNLGLIVEGESGYEIEFWMGEICVAIDGRADKLAEPLVVWGSTDIKTLVVSDPWDLGGGFALEAKQIDLDGGKVWLCLYRNGVELDSEVINAGSSDLQDRVYTYTADVAGEDDVPIVSCYISAVFDGMSSRLVQVRHVFLIDDDVTEIYAGGEYGSMEVVSASAFDITLENSAALTLDPDSTVNIMGNLSFNVADNMSAIEFYPHLTRDELPQLTDGGGFVLDDCQIGSLWNLSEDYSIVVKDVGAGERKARIALLKDGVVVDERILTRESEAPVSSDSYYSYVMDGTEIINATLETVLNGMVGLTKVYQRSEVDFSLLVNNESHSFGGPDLDHITVTPAGPLTMNLSNTQTFNATCYNETAEVTGITVAWNSSNTSAGTIDSSGLLTTVANGTTSITATAYGVVSNAVVVTVGEVTKIPGDVTGNGVINIGDVVLLFNWVSFPDEQGATYVLTKPNNADVTGNGVVNRDDAVRLFNWVSFPNERGTTYVLQ